jgi:hypothetical protein
VTRLDPKTRGSPGTDDQNGTGELVSQRVREFTQEGLGRLGEELTSVSHKELDNVLISRLSTNDGRCGHEGDEDDTGRGS